MSVFVLAKRKKSLCLVNKFVLLLGEKETLGCKEGKKKERKKGN